MQKDIQKKHKNTLLLMILLSVLSVVSIPGIVLGFYFHILYIAIPSIVFVVIGFYGLPMGWVAYGSLRERNGLFQAITQDGITTISDLANTFGKKVKYIENKVAELMKKRYLVNYKFNDDKTEIVEVEKKQPIKKYLCPYCGAKLAKDDLKCPYCGGHI